MTTTGRETTLTESTSIDGEAQGGEKGASKVRLLLVDHRAIMREGLRLLIEQQPDFEVVAQAATLCEAKKVRVETGVHVIVTELELPDARGADVVKALREHHPDTAVLALTLVAHPVKVQQVIGAGAHGYLLKSAAPDDLILGIRSVARGQTYLQPSLGVALARWNGPSETSRGLPHTRLSAKEEEVLRLVALGHTNNEVADLLGLSLRTVETHRARILQKLGRRTRAELVRYAHDAGIVDFSA
ncbi:MAG TPA: response regulator transcription factor [Acidimicrobiales bacterium]|nr:response regulator transcription factor [Acidimicrobiales bacterium]